MSVPPTNVSIHNWFSGQCMIDIIYQFRIKQERALVWSHKIIKRLHRDLPGISLAKYVVLGLFSGNQNPVWLIAASMILRAIARLLKSTVSKPRSLADVYGCFHAYNSFRRQFQTHCGLVRISKNAAIAQCHPHFRRYVVLTAHVRDKLTFFA